MGQHVYVFVGIDWAKSRNAIAIADSERGGEVRYFGEVDAAPDAMRRVVQRIAGEHGRAHLCYEAGSTGTVSIVSSRAWGIHATSSRPR